MSDAPVSEQPDVCVFCGEEADEFEDGLRCKKCAEEQNNEKEDRQ